MDIPSSLASSVNSNPTAALEQPNSDFAATFQAPDITSCPKIELWFHLPGPIHVSKSRSWPELVGELGSCSRKIERENPNVRAIIVVESTQSNKGPQV
ncbi:hypothetical protein Pyn_25898 [Prunus yedoensis var. nudiflora]|uniref:Uncharacterized protein n=1 Tax=Prunus yedoensis var. nudiflora TaxID=2094558 RepID=A0A314XET6_PRUYE|nr:hypothetical protein Pyn_25898 [Prunus yedoensis var. nudiflora]